MNDSTPEGRLFSDLGIEYDDTASLFVNIPNSNGPAPDTDGFFQDLGWAVDNPFTVIGYLVDEGFINAVNAQDGSTYYVHPDNPDIIFDFGGCNFGCPW
jgi:hypothetical protein